MHGKGSDGMEPRDKKGRGEEGERKREETRRKGGGEGRNGGRNVGKPGIKLANLWIPLVRC